MLYEVLIIVTLILFNGALAMSEIAIVSVRKTRLKQLADAGNSRARMALKLANEPGPFLSTVQVGISLVGVLAGAFGGATIAARLIPVMEKSSIPLFVTYADEISFTTVVLLITYLSLVVGELVPKQIALKHSERVSLLVAGPMRLLAKVTHPLVRLLSFSSDILLRVLNKGHADDQGITEEEVKMIISQATEAGAVNTAEHDMLHRVLRLEDIQAQDLMTPRHEVVMLDEFDKREAIWKKVVESGYNYVPVYSRDPANVIGIASGKLLAARAVAGRNFELRANLLPPLFVPETISSLKALEKFRASRSHIALVVNEHGDIEGLLSIHDVLEAVVGEIPSIEGDDDEQAVVKREDGSLLVDGGISALDLRDLLKMKTLPGQDEGTYTTLGGMIMVRLGRIPKTGDHFRWRGWRFEVVDMDRHRVDKVLVKRLPKVARKTRADGSKEERDEGGDGEAKGSRTDKGAKPTKAERRAKDKADKPRKAQSAKAEPTAAATPGDGKPRPS